MNASDIKANSINSMQNKLDALPARHGDVSGYISRPANLSFHFQSRRRQINNHRRGAFDYIASHHIYDSSSVATIDLYNITLNDYSFDPSLSSQFRLYKTAANATRLQMAGDDIAFRCISR